MINESNSLHMTESRFYVHKNSAWLKVDGILTGTHTEEDRHQPGNLS